MTCSNTILTDSGSEPARTSQPLRIWFDLSAEEPGHQREWEHMLRALRTAHDDYVRLVDDFADATCIIGASSRRSATAASVRNRMVRPSASAPPRFVWDASDFPSGLRPGLYCSLPRVLFDHQRHRSFCYPLQYNECVRPFPLEDAQKLFGFAGGITSGLRGRMVRTLQATAHPDEMELTVRNGPWDRMFDRSGLPEKEAYSQMLRRVRFFLCPRGNGVGSVRLFETMQAARVPVILSDEFELPEGIDWSQCSIRVPERTVDALPAILRSRAADWPRLARNARRVWEEHYGPDALLDELARQLHGLMSSRVAPPLRQFVRLIRYWAALQTRRTAGSIVWRLSSR